MANGHPEARDYPVGMVWDEATLVVERQNANHATQAVLTQLAVSSMLSKKGGKEFKRVLKELM